MSTKKANETSASIRKDMRFDKKLMARIDEARGDVSFSAWVRRAVLMRLDGEIPVQPRQTQECPAKSAQKETGKNVHVRTHNAERAEKTRQALFGLVEQLSPEERQAILKARYPKSECRKAIGEAVSKDSMAKYWDEVQALLSK
ncbi:hypothetical protein I3260_18750 [Photobacterium damselae]|uniref:hypothetical protein n=1 Tax=Gammaproteobacteria TaxID=1236 RepID=UPI001EDCA8EC|nr:MULTISPECIES: hypothetical protein [Gammaproteobacteria]MCG3814277.1 hypothetical protein [Photobacterium damselae]MCG3880376.1 hypothetical protein [Psychrobacter sp. Ps6]